MHVMRPLVGVDRFEVDHVADDAEVLEIPLPPCTNYIGFLEDLVGCDWFSFGELLISFGE